MLKEHDPPKEPARVKAQRKWKNNDLAKRVVARSKGHGSLTLTKS